MNNDPQFDNMNFVFNGSIIGDKHLTVGFNSVNSVTINHNLGKYPSIQIFDSAKTEFQADIQHIDFNNCLISWNGITSGIITLN